MLICQPQEDRHDQPQSWGPVYYFPEAIVSKIVVLISLLVAAFLLIGAVVALYFIRSQPARLGTLGGFTLMFAGAVGLLTNSQRSEVFGATAAYVGFPDLISNTNPSTDLIDGRYAAVLVVFVSGNIGVP